MNAINFAPSVRATALAPTVSRPAAPAAPAAPAGETQAQDQISLSAPAPALPAESKMQHTKGSLSDPGTDRLLGFPNPSASAGSLADSLPEGVTLGAGGRLLMTDFNAGTGKLPLTKQLLGDVGQMPMTGSIIGSYSDSRGVDSRFTGRVEMFFFNDQTF